MTPWYHYILVLWCHTTKIVACVLTEISTKTQASWSHDVIV